MTPDPLPTDFDAGPPEDVPVKPDAVALKKSKKAAALAEAKAFEQFGNKVMKIRAKALSVIGAYAEEFGIRTIAHGRILMAGERANEFIDQMDAIIKDLQAKTPPCDPDVIATFIQLKLEANKQLMASGEAHLSADKNAAPAQEKGMTSVSFPSGQPMVIATGPKSLTPDNQIEDAKPKD